MTDQEYFNYLVWLYTYNGKSQEQAEQDAKKHTEIRKVIRGKK